ncbi:MAG: zf-HC2 domain-containing protein [Candidatus Aminicenantes bacterium]|nr:zf-HC2 domain-containing protein [Candidatus Aminicenantes bacterium]
MTCRSVRKLLPLAAGGDISESKAGGVAAHLEACAACRAELEAYRSALAQARGLDGAAGTAWKETDWSRAVRRATAQGAGRTAARPKLVLRPALIAVAGVILLAAVALVLVLSRQPLRPREVLRAGTPEAPREAPAAVEQEPRLAPTPAPQRPTASERDSTRKPDLTILTAKKVEPSRAPVERALTGAAVAPPAPPAPVQGVVSATFISQETGLKIVWFFDRNFDWKGEGR